MIRPTKYEIVCDGCGEVYDDGLSHLICAWNDIDKGERAADKHGWRIIFAPLIKSHYCPKCRKERGL